MMHTKALFVVAGSVASLSSAAFAVEPTVNKDEVRAIVAEMLSDAETRSSLLQGSGSAGYDRNFFLASADNNFRLNVSGQIQFRYVANFRDSDNTVAGSDDFDGGFQSRRTKLRFDGHIVNPNWQYTILSNFSRDSGADVLEEAFVTHNFGNGAYAQAGQFKLPFLREESISSRFQLAAERSEVNQAFSQTRSQGIEVGYKTDDWRFMADFSDGLRTANTDFTSAAESDIAFTGRAEWKWAGDWNDLRDMTSKSDQNNTGLVGLAGHYQISRNTGAPTDIDTNFFAYTLDVQWEMSGWNLFLAGVGSHTSSEAAAASPPDFDDFGLVIQGGYRFNNAWEVFARYDVIAFDDDRGLAVATQHFGTLGVNHYIAGHAAKVTLDGVYAFTKTASLLTTGIVPTSGSILPDTRTGLLGDSEEGEFVLRAQWQLLF